MVENKPTWDKTTRHGRKQTDMVEKNRRLYNATRHGNNVEIERYI